MKYMECNGLVRISRERMKGYERGVVQNASISGEVNSRFGDADQFVKYGVNLESFEHGI